MQVSVWFWVSDKHGLMPRQAFLFTSDEPSLEIVCMFSSLNPATRAKSLWWSTKRWGRRAVRHPSGVQQLALMGSPAKGILSQSWGQ